MAAYDRMANLLIDRHKVESKRLSSGWICFQKNKPLLNKLNEEVSMAVLASLPTNTKEGGLHKLCSLELTGVAISEASAAPPREMKYLTPRVY